MDLALWIQAAGMTLLGACGGVALVDGSTVGDGFTSEISPAVGIDPLSGAFLAVLAMVAVPAAAYATGYLRDAPHARTLAALTGLFPLALVGVLVARDASLFLGFWELMTLVPAAAILVYDSGAGARRAVFQYLAVTHLGGVGVWVAVLVLVRHGALGNPEGLHAAGAGVQALVAVAGIVGFGTKAGLVPFHGWLPRAHPVAPSHISAVMSGVMIKVALYGLVRVLFEWLGGPHAWVGITLLAIGAASALAGVLYALFQRDLKRLLAFSSIENVGIITLGLGAAVVLLDRGQDGWAALALAAALLHTANHAVFKALLFLGAGAFQHATGTQNLDRMGGLLRRMPWTGGAFAIGTVAIAGIPPLNGFASEWLTLQALIGVGRDGALGVALAGALALAALAATAGLAALCFVKVGGLVLAGPGRTPRANAAREAPMSTRVAMAVLAGFCVVLGLLPGLIVPSLARLAPGAPELPRSASIAVPGTSLGTLGAALALVLLVAVFLSVRGRRTAAPAPAWACGQRVGAPLLWTSAAFSKTLLLAAEPVLRPERTVEVEEAGGVVQSVTHRGHVPHHFDAAVYAPVVRAALAVARMARCIQTGDLRMYVGYLVTLVVVLLLLVRAGFLG